MSDTIFHKILAGEIPCEKVYEDDHVLAFLDIAPVNPGHTLVIPKQFAPNALESSEDALAAVWAAIRKIAPAIQKAVGSSGCNITTNIGPVAGQTVFYTHFHIVPRQEDDGLKVWTPADRDAGDLTAMAESIRTHL